MSRAKEAMRRYIDEIEKNKTATWARKTQFIALKDGTLRRVITRRDGTIEKDEIIPADRMLVADYKALEETSYLLRVPKNAKRLLESIAELEPEGGTERKLAD